MMMKLKFFVAAAAALSSFTMAHAAEPAQTAALTQTQSTPDKASMTEGEIKKVNKESGKLTIKHGELKNLNMPPMTMVFRVKDKAMLDQVQTGDKILFIAERIDGNYTVTQLEAKK